MPTKKIKIILFDAYGTLFNEGKESVPKIAEKIVISLKLDISSKELFKEWKKNYLDTEKKVFSGRIKFKTIKEINIESLISTFQKFNIKSSPLEFVDKLFQLWSYPELFPEVDQVLNQLDDYTIGILSNTDSKTLLSAIKYNNLKLDYVFTSEDTGCYKPNRGIFARACEDIGLNNDSIVYVGNSLIDIVGAKQSGLKMVWVNRYGVVLKDLFYRPDYEIKSLNLLVPILQSLK